LNHSFTLDVVVRFAETDAMGVVHHAAYIVWFEAARVAWMAALGIPYQEFAAGGRHFAVTGLTASYRRNCRFGDAVQVHISLLQVRTRQISFAYEVIANGAVIAAATTDHICVDLDGNAVRIPENVLAVMQRVAR
jgi:acyl-CoA thioester hydrolase